MLGATRGVGWGLDLVLGSIALASVLAMGLAFIVGWPDRPDRPDESDESDESIEEPDQLAESGATIS